MATTPGKKKIMVFGSVGRRRAGNEPTCNRIGNQTRSFPKVQIDGIWNLSRLNDEYDSVCRVGTNSYVLYVKKKISLHVPRASRYHFTTAYFSLR